MTNFITGNTMLATYLLVSLATRFPLSDCKTGKHCPVISLTDF